MLFYSAEVVLTLGVYQITRYLVHAHSVHGLLRITTNHNQSNNIFTRQDVNVRSFNLLSISFGSNY